MTATSPCFSTDTVYIDDCGLTLSLLENAEPIEYEVYPNPCTGLFSLRIGGLLRGPVVIEISDYTGRRIEQHEYEVEPNVPIAIDLSDQASGMYFMILRSNDYFSSQRILIAKKNDH